MRKRSIDAEFRSTAGTEKHAREQAPAAAGTDTARFFAAANIAPSKRYVKRVRREIPVAAEETASAFPEIGNDDNVRLVISGAGFQPCFPFAHIIGCSEICVPVAAPDLQS